MNLKVIAWVLAGICAGVIYTKAKKDITESNNNAKNKILSDTTISAEQYNNFSRRVDAGEKTWLKLSDSINDAHRAKADSIKKNYSAKVDSVKRAIIEKYPMSAKKFKALEQKVGNNLSEWEKISNSLKNKTLNDSLKAQQMYKLNKKIADGVKTLRH